MAHDSTQNTFRFALALAVIGGTLLRFFELTARSLWLDEVTSIQLSHITITDVISGSGFDQHTPPLYYLLLHGWFDLVGVSEFNLRLLSLVFDSFNIALVGLIFSEQFNRRFGLIAAFLYALSAYALYYAQEGRMYALLVFFVLISYYLALRCREGRLNAGQSILLVIVGISGMYTHYYYALVLAAITLGVLIQSVDNRARLRWLVAMLIVGLCYLPWVKVIVTLATSGGQVFRRFTFETLPYTAFRFVAGYGNMPITATSKEDILQTLLEHIWIVAVYGLCFTLLFFIAMQTLWRLCKRETVFIALPLFLPAIFATIVSLKTPMLSERYLIVSFPFLIALLSFAFVSRKRLSQLVCSTALALMVFALYQHFENPKFGNTQWREAIGVIKADDDTPTIVVSPSYALFVVEFYAGKSAKVVPYGQPASGESIWLIERRTAESVLKEFKGEGFQVRSEELFHKENGIRLYELAKGL